MAIDHAAYDAAMKRLEPFIGEWSIEADFPGAPPPGDIGARTTFEWILDRRFLLQRSEVPVEEAPNGHIVVGFDAAGGGYTQHYFDSRGVVRVYAMTFEDGVWTLLRDKPDFTPLDFHQRFEGEFSEDGDVMSGRWESSADGSTWELDFHLKYTRVG